MSSLPFHDSTFSSETFADPSPAAFSPSCRIYQVLVGRLRTLNLESSTLVNQGRLAANGEAFECDKTE